MVVEKGRSSKVGLLVVAVVVVWWRGGDNNNARARAGTSRKTPSLFYLCVFVCLDGGLFCLFCLIVSSCFVLFCWVGLCIRFIYYLSTAHSSFPRYSKKRIPQGFKIPSPQENRMSDSLALSDVMGSESNEWLHNPWTFVVFAG